MVRVISVHHFSSQHIHVCDDPVAVTSASPDRLLVALANHVVQVRDLANGGEVEFTFPTVDKVQQIVYCPMGNFVAMLENKPGRQGKVLTYARIYINWDVPSQSRENAVVRARIAGRVTPSSQQCSEGIVEMIELPTKRTPSVIACCEMNGSILLASNKSLSLYLYCVRTHDISRMKFIDFEESGLSLELSFAPTHLNICEDIIVCMNSQCVHLFKISQQSENFKDLGVPVQSTKETHSLISTSTNSKDYIDWDAVLSNETSEVSSQIDPSSYPIITNLPSIASEQLSESNRQTPFTAAAQDVTVNVKCGSPAMLWIEGIKIINLLQLKINPIVDAGGCVSREEFRCLVLKPFYVKNKLSRGNDSNGLKHPLKSSNYSSLASVVCIVATQQEGYFYYFPMPSMLEHNGLKLQQNACITVYPFTAPVSALVFEHSILLHALTETGLETYTTRGGHYLIQQIEHIDNLTNACPAPSDAVCLVGLRPFLGVEYLVLSNSHLVLLASSEGSSVSSKDSQSNSWTLYSLRLPPATTLYTDILSVGASHRWSSPSTYLHLLSEAHVILRTIRSLVKPNVSNEAEYECLNDELYSKSCAHLGDFYLSGECEDSWQMSFPYYKLSGLTPFNVINRLEHDKHQPYEPSEENSVTYIPGLMHYLKTCLLQMNTASDELLFTPAVPTFINLLLDLFETNSPKQVSGLVLSSKVLREHATDRVLAIMKTQLNSGPSPEPADALALALLCVQKNFPSQAISVLNSISTETLSQLLTLNHHLVLETTKDARRDKQSPAFTELATILFDTKPTLIAQVLFNLVTEDTKIFHLGHILQVFVELLPRMGMAANTASPMVQCFLEQYFTWYYEENPEISSTDYNETTIDALKILIRSYLSDLQRTHYPTAVPSSSLTNMEQVPLKVLFEECRPGFLTRMEPVALCCSPTLGPNYQEDRSTHPTLTLPSLLPSRTSNSLCKLQALLASDKLPTECVAETHHFVKTHTRTHGHLTLLALCLPVKAAADVILNFCPEATLQFCLDKFESDSEWQWIITKLQQKIKSMEDDNFQKEHCIQILTDVLTHLSQTLSLESLVPMLPPGEKSIQTYIRTCQEMSHASHINALLVTTGHQLLNTLNL